RREIDVTRDVLQPGEEKRIVVSAVPEVAHQRAAVALWVVVLALAEPVIDHEQGPAFENTAQRCDQSRTGASKLTEIGRWRAQPARLCKQLALLQRPFVPNKPRAGPGNSALANATLVPRDEVDRQRIEHFVADDGATKNVR